MTMLDVDVADAETVARPAAKSADTKAAIYLKESGASPICIVERYGKLEFAFGKVHPKAVETWWIAAQDARAVAVLARKIAGKSPDIAGAEAAIIEAARRSRATLTESHVALQRAGEMAQRLDQFMDGLRGTGRLREFNRMFKRRRMAAMLNGRGFMSHAAAEARLRKALVPLLQGGNVQTQSLFAAVFGS